MKKITTDILIIEVDDIIDMYKHDFDISNLNQFIKYFRFDDVKMMKTASLILFVDSDGTTTILKNRYGKNQI